MQDPVSQFWVFPGAGCFRESCISPGSEHTRAGWWSSCPCFITLHWHTHRNMTTFLVVWPNTYNATHVIVTNTPDEGNSLTPAMPSLKPWLIKHHKQLEMPGWENWVCSARHKKAERGFTAFCGSLMRGIHRGCGTSTLSNIHEILNILSWQADWTGILQKALPNSVSPWLQVQNLRKHLQRKQALTKWTWSPQCLIHHYLRTACWQTPTSVIYYFLNF